MKQLKDNVKKRKNNTNNNNSNTKTNIETHNVKYEENV